MVLGGVDEFAREQRTDPGARLLQLLGIGIAVELSADQHAGVGIAICEAPVVKVSEKAQGLALRRLSSAVWGSAAVSACAFALVGTPARRRGAPVSSRHPPRRALRRVNQGESIVY